MKSLSWLKSLRARLSVPQAYRRRRRRSASSRARGHAEVLEDRTLLSAIVVTSTADIVDAADGVTTLREAIIEANTNSGPDTIKFNIPLTDPGAVDIDLDGNRVFVIQPGTPLPALDDSSGGTKIDGFSQVDTNQLGPEIVIDGSVMADNGELLAGLHLASDNSEVHGLNIRNFPQHGIYAPGNGIRILGNFIGTDATGRSAQGNSEGIRVEGAETVIGGDLTNNESRNVISGNGIGIRTFMANQTVVQGNFIGTTADGLSALANGGGIRDVGTGGLFGSDSDGISDASERNIISGNIGAGIHLLFPSQGATIAGNYIGLNVTGSQTIPNGNGVFLEPQSDASVGNTTIGGTVSAARNIISGNLQAGIGGATRSAIQIQGNYIGTDVTGTFSHDVNGSAFGNQIGISLTSSVALIGGTQPGAGNIISGNLGGGLGVSFVNVQGNYVGLDATGTRALGNGGIGIRATSATIGGTAPGAGNVVSANTGFGIDARSSTIQGNIVGYDATGTSTFDVDGNSLGNSTSIDVRTQDDAFVGGTAPTDGNLISHTLSIFSGTATVQGNNIHFIDVGTAEDALIGGSAPGAANIIPHGIDLRGSERTRVQGNFIGVAADGQTRIGRGGIRISTGAIDNIIGTDGDEASDDAEGNILTFVEIYGSLFINAPRETSGNVVAGNMIGTNADGTQALGDGGWVFISHGASDNVIGTNGDGKNDDLERNVIAGVLQPSVFARAVYIDGFRNAVAGNFIGTDETGEIDFGNQGHGIEVNSLVSFALYNRIGTNGDGVSDDLEGNVIAFNGKAGFATNGQTNGHSVRGNSIYSNDGLGIDHDLNGVTPNDGDSLIPGGPNGKTRNRQNFPELTSAIGGSQTFVTGTLNSLPDTKFLIDFYANSATDPSGHGEGRRWLGYVEVDSDSNGDLSFAETLQAATTADEFVTATATRFEDTDGNTETPQVTGETSEFSASLNVVVIDLFVTNTNDAGAGSFRQALLDANAIQGPNVIRFDIPRSDGFDVDSDGLGDIFFIPARSSLPSLADATGGTTIDGRTQYTFVAGGDPRIILASASRVKDDLTITSDHNRVFGLNVLNTTGNGIVIDGGNSNWIAANYIGTDHTGAADLPTAGNGVYLRGGASENIIGTNGDGVDDATERNVISDNSVGVQIDGGSDRNVIAGNRIGVDAAGTTAAGNSIGIEVGDEATGAAYNRIGTNGDGISDAIERNIISGNGAGLRIRSNSFGNLASGNFFGVDVTGTTPLPNTLAINIFGGAQDNRIGTDGDGVSDAAERNLISGNNSGVSISGIGTANNLIAGNFIGTDITGSEPLGNRNGVRISNGASSNQIGGSPELANVIAFNTNDGIQMVRASRSSEYPTANSIRANSIHSNGGEGIDLTLENSESGDGVTANDTNQDADTGPNNLQNYPILRDAVAGENTPIDGWLQSSPNSLFVIDVYASRVKDPSGHGEGERYLDSFEVTTDASGFSDLGFNRLLNASTTGGEFVTATATKLEDLDDNPLTPPIPTDTSEFSPAVEARDVLRGSPIGDNHFLIEEGQTASEIKVTLTTHDGESSFVFNSSLVDLIGGNGGSNTFVINGLPSGTLRTGGGNQDDVFEANASVGGELVIFGDISSGGADKVTVNAASPAGIDIDLGDGDDLYIVNYGAIAGRVVMTEMSGADIGDRLQVKLTDRPERIVKARNTITHQWLDEQDPVQGILWFSTLMDVQFVDSGTDDEIIDPRGRRLLAETTGDGENVILLTQSDAEAITAYALQLWTNATGVTPMIPIQVMVADLPGNVLGSTNGHAITLDADAAGVGWFIDATPFDSVEFDLNDPEATGRYDLLTAAAHEVGHALGYEHAHDGVMAETLTVGARRLPENEEEPATEPRNESDSAVVINSTQFEFEADQTEGIPVAVPLFRISNPEEDGLISDTHEASPAESRIVFAFPPKDEDDADTLFADFVHSLADDLLTV